jgi:hypothetical protein
MIFPASKSGFSSFGLRSDSWHRGFGVLNRCLWSGVAGLERHVGADFFQESLRRCCWSGWPRRGFLSDVLWLIAAAAA